MGEKQGKRLKLAVQVGNTRSLNFFLSHGFEISGITTETDYIPQDMVLRDLDMSQQDDREEFVRLVEHTWSISYNGG